jgi:CRISPR-associated protein Csm1
VDKVNKRSATVVFGALLHDVGKIGHRAGEAGTHSETGRRMLKPIVADDGVLSCVAYHHEAALRRANLAPDDPAYIVNLADNISAAADRRAEEGGDSRGFDRSLALESIFNHIHGAKGTGRLPVHPMEKKLRFPEAGLRSEAADYRSILRELLDGLKGIKIQPDWINSLMALMEAWTAGVPSSTAIGERADISLYDHSRIAAAVAACISDYLEASGRNDLRRELLEKSGEFCAESAFLLFSADLSGIQSFIYTVATENALRSLRSRSFYLEIFMEHVIDELLEACGLSRANLLYSGGGHCYLLLPNTLNVQRALTDVMDCVRGYLLENFGLKLYLAHAAIPCSANDLMNRPAEQAPYTALYRRLSELLSQQKLRRYSAAEIRKLNAEIPAQDGRECKVCGTSQNLMEDGLCRWCRLFVDLSRPIQDQNVYLLRREPSPKALPLPSLKGTVYLYFESEEGAKKQLETKQPILRVYTKNLSCTGLNYATRLYVGDYHASNSMGELVKQANGIRRLAVCRADVDNLGAVFLSGFVQTGETEAQRSRFVTLSRTATLSRQMSMFFKYHINGLLSGDLPEECISLYEKNSGLFPKNRALPVSIVYSGGDDLFLLGAWDGVLCAILRIQQAFERYTGGSVRLSGGLGLFGESYPIRRAALMTEELVEEAKSMEGKNALSLFETEKGHNYSWASFIENVLGEKLLCIQSFFKTQRREEINERGMAFLYHLMELLRGCDEQINLARIAYLLARMEPSEAGARTQYQHFSRDVMRWCRLEEERRQLITAIYLYVYEERGGDEHDSGQ